MASARVVEAMPRLSLANHPSERCVVVGPISRRENRKCNHIEVLSTSRDFVSVDRSDPIGGIAKRSASECTEDGVPDVVIAQCVELCRDPAAGVAWLERRTLP